MKIAAALLILFALSPSQAAGLWERAYAVRGQSKVPTPHPMAYFLHFSATRYKTDIGNSLCLGCKTKEGQTVTIASYAVKSSQREVGESFGRKIIEVDLTFDIKPGSVMSKLRREMEQQSQMSFADLTPVEWQSIVMQSAPNLYRGLFFISNGPSNRVPTVDARVTEAGGVPLLAVRQTFSGGCAEGYWELDRDGPWLLDFSPVQKAIAKVIPPNSEAPQTGCWALSIDRLEVKAGVQKDNPKCAACGWLGTAVVDFKIANDQVVPVSSDFEPSNAN